jgi:hypothetical protein
VLRQRTAEADGREDTESTRSENQQLGLMDEETGDHLAEWRRVLIARSSGDLAHKGRSLRIKDQLRLITAEQRLMPGDAWSHQSDSESESEFRFRIRIGFRIRF